MNVFEMMESNVRSYCRSFPVIFERGKADKLYTEQGVEYIDFFAGAGALNYGHNHDLMKERMIAYLQMDGILHGLDMYTKAKQQFIESFEKIILHPRQLQYKIQFCGPTGTNAVEAALKLARKVTGRTNIFAFMGGFHGMSLGSLAASSNKMSRQGAGIPLGGITFIPFEKSPYSPLDSISYMEQLMDDTHSGVEKPAAVIVETVQAEGGVYVSEKDWLVRLRKWCNKHEVLLICDDIQVGCGRTGTFFSFEHSGIVPDMVLLSKSISGAGLPMSLLLMRPDLDIWEPGEHNGTFRGNQLAFITAKAALEIWDSEAIELQVAMKHNFIRDFIEMNILPLHDAIKTRGIGMIWGIDLGNVDNGRWTKEIISQCFQNGLIIERAGRHGSVIKIMPPLNIQMENLKAGCGIIQQSMRTVLTGHYVL